MVVVPGFRHGLHVVLRTLAATGVTRVGLEDPGPTDSDVIARASGLEPVPSPSTTRASTSRPCPVRRPARSGDPGAPVPDRCAAVGPAAPGPGRVGAHGGGVVIEDDYDAEFRYDRQPVGSVQGLRPTA